MQARMCTYVQRACGSAGMRASRTGGQAGGRRFKREMIEKERAAKKKNAWEGSAVRDITIENLRYVVEVFHNAG